MLAYYERYATEAKEILENIPFAVVNEITQCLINARRHDQIIFVMGNGGSAATASHFATDLGKGEWASPLQRFRIIALTDNLPLITAWANDTEYSNIFAAQLQSFMRRGDIVIGVSSSGNSPNILNALKVARNSDGVTIGFTGFDGGRMKDLVDYCCTVPSTNVQHIEDVHMLLMHMIYSYIRDLDAGRF